MTVRAAKVLLVSGVALFYTLVVLNNVTDYNSNYQFLRHVLMMDSTIPGNHGMWRALSSSAWHTAFYVLIIGWESIVMVLCWWGAWRMMRVAFAPASALAFNSAKGMTVIALTLALLMWLVAFLDVGGEWFLMWQSRMWNGEEAASRMFTVIGIVLLLLIQPDPD